jgi:hypothetical protein
MGTCSRCALLREHEDFSDNLTQKSIKTVQIEPSLACNLSCLCCSQPGEIHVRPKPFLLPLPIFNTILASLRRNQFHVGEIEYCGQGEPLMHPSFPSLVETARGHFPSACQRLITNGNFDYWKATRGVALDEIFVSCDGFFPESYVKYRVGGDVRLPLQFLRDVPHEAGGRRQTIIWKYILFEFNDTDREIRAAQAAANDLGVDLLLFVFTTTQYKSKRYGLANGADFPVYCPNVVTSATPTIQRQCRQATPTGTNRFEHSEAMSVLDEVAVLGNGKLWVRGWALTRGPLERIEVELDGELLGCARRGLARPDVHRAYPQYDNRYSGFEFAEARNVASGTHRIGIRLVRAAMGAVHFARDFRFPSELNHAATFNVTGGV